MNSEQMVPYVVHEGMLARMERTIKRLWILSILMFLALVASNAAWIYYESQWEVIETTQEVDQDIDTGDGTSMITGIGSIYGKSEAESENDYEE